MELAVVGLVYLPSLFFDACKRNPSTRISFVLMTVPAALSLIQDITFYYALTMIASSTKVFIVARGVALPLCVLFTKWLFSKVYT